MGLNFLLKFLHHRNFPVVWPKSIWAQSGRKHLTFRLRSRYSTTAPLHPCVCKAITFMCSLPGFSGRFCSYRKPNFPAVSGSYLPGFYGRICSYWQSNFLGSGPPDQPSFALGRTICLSELWNSWISELCSRPRYGLSENSWLSPFCLRLKYAPVWTLEPMIIISMLHTKIYTFLDSGRNVGLFGVGKGYSAPSLNTSRTKKLVCPLPMLMRSWKADHWSLISDQPCFATGREKCLSGLWNSIF